MSKTVQSVERALQLLNVIANSDSELSVAEMATKAKVNRATAWRLLNTLEEFDLIKKNENAGTYALSLGLWNISRKVKIKDFIDKSRPYLEKLVEITGGNAYLEMTSGENQIVLCEVKSRDLIQVNLSDLVIPLHCGSVGKLYLSSLKKEELEEFFKQKLVKLTPYTKIDKNNLLKDIVSARKEGVAFNYKEHQEEWCGITSAVRDLNGKDVAYINLTLPTFNTTEKQLHKKVEIMKKVAQQISNLLIN